MNGARSTFMRKGYLLTALAAVALLALSPGTAVAQQNTTGVTITGPSMNTINEGGNATYTVSVRGYVAAAVDADSSGAIDQSEVVASQSFTVTLGTPTPNSTDGALVGEAVDLNTNAHVLVATFNTPRNASTNALLFTDSKTISVATLHDNDAENEAFDLSFTLSGPGGLVTTADGTVGTDDIALATAGTAANPNALTIDDDETQTYTLTLAPNQMPTEGVGFTVNLAASPAHVNGTGSMNVILDKQAPAWTLAIGDSDTANPAVVTAGTPDNVVELTITQAAGDRNRVTDTVTVSAHTGVVGASMQQASLSVDVADADLLQAVTAKVVDDDGVALATQPTSVEEGKSVKIAVMTVDKDGMVTNANEALTIALSSSGTANAQDFRLSAPVMITSGQPQSNTVELMIETDEDVGMESLILDATVSGEAANGSETSTSEGVLSLYIDDATEKSIEPKATEADYDKIKAAIADGAGDDGMLNPGEMVTLMTADLFELAEGYTGSYSVSVEGNAVSASASGETVNIEAVMAGESKVTVTGTARMSSSLMADQTVSNVASLTFPVEVVDMPLMITLEMPDNVMDGNIVEGETYMITAQANRMITEAEGSIEVTLMRDRSQSDADESDYSVGSATIMAGYDSATAELMVTEDMMPDAGTDDNMGEQLVLYGMAGDMELNALTFTIWDAAVPALPLIAQILLALFLALGGARLYRRRQG